MKQEEMRNAIHRLMWEDIDMFFTELLLTAKEETQRKVISSELKEWWENMKGLLKDWPFDHLPKDD